MDERDDAIRFAEWFVAEVLGYTEEKLRADVDALERAGKGPDSIPAALYERHRVRAGLTGALPGLRDDLTTALAASVMEHSHWLRRDVSIRAARELAEDPMFFDRPDWACRALDIDSEHVLPSLIFRNAKRFVGRLALLRAGRLVAAIATTALSPLTVPATGAALGAAFNVWELSRLCDADRDAAPTPSVHAPESIDPLPAGFSSASN